MSHADKWKDEAEKRRYFETELLDYMDAIHDTALRLTRNQADADDLVQATMFKAYRFLDHFEHGTNAKAWLSTILRNTFINERRRRQRQPVTLDLDDDRTGPQGSRGESVADTGDGIGHEAMMDEISQEIAQALAALSEEYRQALLLSDIDGYSYQEVADIMNCPIGTVRSRISRARKQLREQLAGFAGDGDVASDSG